MIMDSVKHLLFHYGSCLLMLMIHHQYARVRCIEHHSTKELCLLIHLFSFVFVMRTPPLTLVTGTKYIVTQFPEYSKPIKFVEFHFRILGNNSILDLFTIDKHTGQLFIKDTMALDVNHLKSENIFFSVEVISNVFESIEHSD